MKTPFILLKSAQAIDTELVDNRLDAGQLWLPVTFPGFYYPFYAAGRLFD